MFQWFFTKTRSLLQAAPPIGPALNLALTIFFIETLISLWSVQYLPNALLIVGYRENLFFIIEILFFLFRSISLHVVFAICLWALEWIFEIKHRKVFYTFILIYGFFHIILYHPQSMEEFQFLNSAVLFIIRFLTPQFAVFIGVVGLLILNFSVKKKLLMRILTSVLLVFYLVYAQNPYFKPLANFINENSRQHRKNPFNIIIISIDSLRYDSNIKDPVPDSIVNQFLENSFRFEAAISPIAKTQGALTSLFTGKIPPENGVRGLLRTESINTDEGLKNSYISILKQNNYRTELMLDNPKYCQFSSGKVFDRVHSLEPGLSSFFIPALLRSRLIFSFFDNVLGEFFIPHIRSQSLYSLGNPLAFTFDVTKNLNRLSQEETPFFLMAHTTMLHWPAANIYPFYPNLNNSTEKLPLSMSSTLGIRKRNSSISINPEEKSLKFHRLYQLSVDQTREAFLKPLLNEISRKGLLENSIVVLMSDHGESWNSTVEVQSEPKHGVSLKRQHDSEKAFLAIHVPGQKGLMLKKNAGLIDVLPTVLNLAKIKANDSLPPLLKETTAENVYYSETDPEPLALKRSANLKNQPSPNEMLQVDTQTQKLYLLPEYSDRALILNKQRAVISKEHRLTLYWSRYGYRIFLCDYKKDPRCLENQAHNQMDVTKFLWKYLIKFSKNDIEAGTLPPFELLEFPWASQPLPVSVQWLWSSDNSNPWIRFQRASELIQLWHDNSKGTEILLNLIADKKTPSYLQEQSELLIVQTCSSRGYTVKSFPQWILKNLNLYSDTYLQKLLQCANLLKSSNWAAEIKNQIYLNEQDNKKFINSFAAGLKGQFKSYSQQRLEHNDNLRLEKIKNLNDKSIPIMDRIQNFKEKDMWAYEDTGRKQDFYFRTDFLLKNENPKLSIVEQSRRLAEEILPVNYFNFLLKESGASPLLSITPNRIKTIFTQSMKGQDLLQVPSYERSYALLHFENLVCKKWKDKESCSQVRQYLKKYPESIWWKNLILVHKNKAALKKLYLASDTPEIIRLVAKTLDTRSEP